MNSVLTSAQPTIPIVGIGASAGGIDALEYMLAAFTADSAAFVVVTHLPRGKRSYLPNVLQRYTVLEVDTAASGALIKPNHIYVVPESEHVALQADRLIFEHGSTVRARNIDHFFVSLAQSRGSEAIGVVLSGANFDGTVGLEAILAAGGTTFVQSVETARFTCMPSSASKSAQHALEPAELGRQIMALLLERERERVLVRERQRRE